MFDTQNLQNMGLFGSPSLDLNFKKNKKRNASTTQLSSCSDRKNKVITTTPVGLKTDRSALIEKKKNYSNAIRQRNLNLLCKKKLQLGSQQYQTNCQSRALYQLKQNVGVIERKERAKTKNRSQKPYLILSQKKNYHLSSISAIDFDPIPFLDENNQNNNDQTIENIQNNSFLLSPTMNQYQKNQSQKEQQEVREKNLTLCSNVCSQKISVLDSDATILAKQNATFKRDLATFKKQNSLLRKQLKDAQSTKSTYIDNIKQLQEKAKSILQCSLLHSIRNSNDITQIQTNVGDNSQQIIQKLRRQITDLRNLNRGLQLRTHMAEKKAFQQVTQCKKKMTKQLNQWREKCTKLRAQNMKLKNFKDKTIQMEISKDQQ